MKILISSILLIIFSIILLNPCCAKKGLDENNPSVQLLQTLTQEGKVIRQNDQPIAKADTYDDTTLVKELKQKYYEENKNMLDVGKNKKNPD